MVPYHPEGFTVGKVSSGSGLSDPWVRQKLSELVAVGILESDKVGHERVYYPIPKYHDLLSKPLSPLNHGQDLQGEEKKH